jgi:hypothetical protein
MGLISCKRRRYNHPSLRACASLMATGTSCSCTRGKSRRVWYTGRFGPFPWGIMDIKWKLYEILVNKNIMIQARFVEQNCSKIQIAACWPGGKTKDPKSSKSPKKTEHNTIHQNIKAKFLTVSNNGTPLFQCQTVWRKTRFQPHQFALAKPLTFDAPLKASEFSKQN